MVDPPKTGIRADAFGLNYPVAVMSRLFVYSPANITAVESRWKYSTVLTEWIMSQVASERRCEASLHQWLYPIPRIILQLE
jgi:hypothetical protein